MAGAGAEEIHLGKKQKFITVVSNLDSGERVWFGREKKKETLDEFFLSELSVGSGCGSRRPAWTLWQPYRLSVNILSYHRAVR